MVEKSDGKVLLKKKGGIPEIIDAIMYADQQGKDHTRELALKLNTPKKIFNWVFSEIDYKRDGAGSEVIQLPSRLYRTRKGDCKSISVFVGSLLHANNIPFVYRFANYGKENFWHVYPVAKMPGGKEIILDVVLGKYNVEEPYKKKMDYKTDIQVVRGVNTTRKGVVPKKNFINTLQWTDGEIGAALLYERLNIMYSATGKREYLKNKETLKDILFVGLHSPDGKNKIQKLAPDVAAKIKSLSTKRKVRREKKKVGINDPLIPLQDCDSKTLEWLSGNPAAMQAYQLTGNYTNFPIYRECLEENNSISLLNNHFEESAHHLLYEYVSNPNSKPQTVATKSVLHKIAMDKIAEITDLDRGNLRSWARNGILRNSASRGFMLSPEESIQGLEQAQREGIGFPVPAIIALISAIAAAATKVVLLIGAMEQSRANQLRQAAQGIGTPGFGPQKQDWILVGPDGQPAPPGAQPSGNINHLLLIGGGLLLARGAKII